MSIIFFIKKIFFSHEHQRYAPECKFLNDYSTSNVLFNVTMAYLSSICFDDQNDIKKIIISTLTMGSSWVALYASPVKKDCNSRKIKSIITLYNLGKPVQVKLTFLYI